MYKRQVPAFHALATENSGLRWDFWVRHYADDAQQFKDPNFRTEHDGREVNGVLYPRAASVPPPAPEPTTM